jgi:hypothetical protein
LGSLKRWLRQKTQKLIFVLSEPITKRFERITKRLLWELERANLPARDVTITNPLTAHGRKFFSQNDEDGILLEILGRLEASQPSIFLEFGVDDGTECNTILLALGWVGSGQLSFDLPANGSRLKYMRQWITRDNAASLAREGLARLNAELRNVQVVSVDLDGNDGPIVRALLPKAPDQTYLSSSIMPNFRQVSSSKCLTMRSMSGKVTTIMECLYKLG